MKTSNIFLMLAICFLLTQCTNQEAVKPTASKPSNTLFDIPTNTNQRATSYLVADKYLRKYEHYYQYNLWSGAGRYNLCGPTSYMVLTGMIANANGRGYDVSQSRLKSIYEDLVNKHGTGVQRGTSVSQLHYNSQRNEANYISSYQEAGGREHIKGRILHYLSKGLPVVMPVKINSRNSEANDLDMKDQSGKNYYITENGGVGHFVVILGLHLTEGGSGSIIYYADVYDSQLKVKKVSYTRLLDANKATSDWNSYSLLTGE
jgi:hypothetical protein